MGKEARVLAEIDGWEGEGKLLLETDELFFRGARRLTVPLASITSLSNEKGWLHIVHEAGDARFDLGDAYAEKWMHAIRNPRQLIDKLDVKAASTVVVEGDVDAAFVESIRARAASLREAAPNAASPHAAGDAGRAAVADVDLVFIAIDDPASLSRITDLRRAIKSNGAIWVLHPRGRRELSHDAIMAVAKPAGLVDVKSARFNETHGALKLMVPRAER
jgi:hypothetical protein